MNTYGRHTYFGSIFDRASSNSVYGSIFEKNMDNSSFNNWNESLIKTITLPRQAFGGYQDDVLAISEIACKVSLCSFFTLKNNVWLKICNIWLNIKTPLILHNAIIVA